MRQTQSAPSNWSAGIGALQIGLSPEGLTREICHRPIHATKPTQVQVWVPVHELGHVGVQVCLPTLLRVLATCTVNVILGYAGFLTPPERPDSTEVAPARSAFRGAPAGQSNPCCQPQPA